MTNSKQIQIKNRLKQEKPQGKNFGVLIFKKG